MSKKTTPPTPDPTAYLHQDKRVFIPAETEAGAEQINPKVRAHTLRELDKNPIVHRGQDPELKWLGKYDHEGEQPDYLQLDIRSLYRHEHIRPQELMARLYRERLAEANDQLGLFGQDYQTVDELDKPLSYYQHHAAWENRLILGDSLSVMTSLLEREGLDKKVQMVYLDPPYGIKYGSNWQIKLNNRTVTDGKDEHLSSEPEQIKAFRDTWELGIHSYLSYLRDRLLVARELLTESGSCFVQISDENVHLVRNLMDEIFGSDNFFTQIVVKKTAAQTDDVISSSVDYIIWYAKNRSIVKAHTLFTPKEFGGDYAKQYRWVEEKDGHRRRLNPVESLPKGARAFRPDNLTSSHEYSLGRIPFEMNGIKYSPGGRYWSTSPEGLLKLQGKKRLVAVGNTLDLFLNKLFLFDQMPVPDSAR